MLNTCLFLKQVFLAVMVGASLAQLPNTGQPAGLGQFGQSNDQNLPLLPPVFIPGEQNQQSRPVRQQSDSSDSIFAPFTGLLNRIRGFFS